MRARRLAVPAEQRERAAAAAAARGLEVLRPEPGSIVSAFRSVQGEIDTGPLIGGLLASGAVVVLPRVLGAGEPLDFHAWRPGEPLVPVAMGLLEPAASSPRLVPSCLVVPLLAFDRQGRRLGYGGGFFDRTLRRLRAMRRVRAIGYAFEAQRLDEVPAGPDDERLDLVVTEAALHDCRLSAEG
jgi:5-formyltetrahydrofolate cyclo-ligase